MYDRTAGAFRNSDRCDMEKGFKKCLCKKLLGFSLFKSSGDQCRICKVENTFILVIYVI